MIWEQDEEGDSTAKSIIEVHRGGGEEWEMVCHVMELRRLKSLSWMR